MPPSDESIDVPKQQHTLKFGEEIHPGVRVEITTSPTTPMTVGMMRALLTNPDLHDDDLIWAMRYKYDTDGAVLDSTAWEIVDFDMGWIYNELDVDGKRPKGGAYAPFALVMSADTVLE